MAKFTILKPQSGYPLRIPTVPNLIIDFTFPLLDPEFRFENIGLRVILPDNTILVFDDLLKAAAVFEEAPLIMQPGTEPINTHTLLITLGVQADDFAQATQKKVAAEPETSESDKHINELLASSLDMEAGWHSMSDMLDTSVRASWTQSSYALPVPFNDAGVCFHAQLGGRSGKIMAGTMAEFYLFFSEDDNAVENMQSLAQPVMFYFSFIPGAENYSLHNFFDMNHLQVEGGDLINKEWESTPQGGCLLRLIIAAGEISCEIDGHPCIKLSLPLYDTYIKGATCSITLVSAVGWNMREDADMSVHLVIEPSYNARVIYASPTSAEAFCLTAKTRGLMPPNLVIRALNFGCGDIVHITELLTSLGPGASYSFKPQGDHLLLRISGNNLSYRLLLENCAMEEMLRNDAFIATDQPHRDWTNYRYISEQYVRENAVEEADVLLSVEYLLNALSGDEDYQEIQMILNNLHSDET